MPSTKPTKKMPTGGSTIRVKVVKSFIGQKPTNKNTLKSMGLGRVGAERIFLDTPSIRGQIHKVKHMVTVEAVEGSKK